MKGILIFLLDKKVITNMIIFVNTTNWIMDKMAVE